MPRSSRTFVHFAAAALMLCAGCGPFGYLKKVAKDANRAVSDARAVGAEQYAPYEYWGSVAYLEQAKVLMGYSEYERSFDYGTRSVQLANEAKVKAERVEQGKSVETNADVAAPADKVDADGAKLDPKTGKPAEPKAKDAGEKKAGAKADVKVGGKVGGPK